MTLKCRDLTQAKLFLALEFLDFLNRFADEVVIYCSAHNAKAYQPLEKLYKNIRFQSNQIASAEITFIDDKDQDSQSSLVFPILNNDPMPDPIPSSWIPLQKGALSPEYLVPEQSSAQDMVQKITSRQDLKGLRLLISAGPTAEDLDPVRFLTNRSSGKMGVSLARAAFIRGAQLQLVYGPGTETVPLALPVDFVRSAEEMAHRVLHHLPASDIYIGTAAVADYTPLQTASQKIKKSSKSLQLKMKRTKDILRLVSEQKTNQKVVGFSMETENVLANSVKKLEEKNLDMIVINNPNERGSGFSVDTNKVSVLLKNGQMYNLPLQSKLELSHKLLDFIRDQVQSNV